MAGRHLTIVLILASAAAAGCGGPGVSPADLSAYPPRDATAAELVALINAGADTLRALKADLDLSYRGGPEGRERGCSGKLIALRGPGGSSASIHLKGYRKLVPTFFTLISDGEVFWLHVPGRNTVYTGPIERGGAPAEGGAPAGAGEWGPGAETNPADTAAIGLEAADLSRALFVAPLDASLERSLEEEGDRYILTLSLAGKPRRRLVIERRLFCVAGETYYTDLGEEELVLLRSRYTLAAGAPYPLSITIRKPGAEIGLEIRELDLSPGAPGPSAFSLRAPAGAKIERIR